ncbi:MAG: SDR family oxidoreductase [Dehalococcoidales bacterium]|nr:SDR family oxidoreductase [Dehalococcoidales bacterium]
MVILVTGASGHIGANLVRALLKKGQKVRALVHHERRALEGLDIETIDGDICEPESLIRAVEGAEAVYHLAGNISLMMDEWPLVRNINVTGTQNVIDACIKWKVKRLIYFSSIHAIQPAPEDKIINESCALVDSPKCPPYDRSKAAGERLVRQAVSQGLDAIIINPTGVLGPYDYQPSHFGLALVAIANGKMPALISGGFNWVDVRDVAEGAITAAEHAPAGTEYLLSGHYVSVHDIGKMVGEITRVSVPGFITPMWLARTVAPLVTAYNRLTGRRQYFTSVSLRALRETRPVSHEKATRELGYQPRPFKETLVDTLQWFAENGQVKI